MGRHRLRNKINIDRIWGTRVSNRQLRKQGQFITSGLAHTCLNGAPFGTGTQGQHTNNYDGAGCHGRGPHPPPRDGWKTIPFGMLEKYKEMVMSQQQLTHPLQTHVTVVGSSGRIIKTKVCVRMCKGYDVTLRPHHAAIVTGANHRRQKIIKVSAKRLGGQLVAVQLKGANSQLTCCKFVTHSL